MSVDTLPVIASPASALAVASRLEAEFDWKRPNYAAIYSAREKRIRQIHGLNARQLRGLKSYYRENPADFISDFGLTFDPRNVSSGLPSVIPFVLFPKQREAVQWALDRWRNNEPGIWEKSRETGATWLAVALSCTLCLFHHQLVIGFGSRKEVYVDNGGDPKSIFFKARFFLENLPAIFRGGWIRQKHTSHMRIWFPEAGSALTGESGDGIGRGDRTAMYWVDEAAFLERPLLTDASLSQTTRCRIDISTPNGMANSFAQKRHSGKVKVFTFHWMFDPRKDQAWYDKQCRDIANEVIVNQELNISYLASVEGQVIPADWAQAAVGAAQKLGIEPTGMRRGGLDVADEGNAVNAFAGRHGIELDFLKHWSGKGSDIYKTVEKAFAICDERGYDGFDYDADGVGAGCRGDALNINTARRDAGLSWISDSPFRGSGAVDDPDGEMVHERKNKDFFANLKAQSWWSLRLRFQNTYRAVVEGMEVDPDTIISISPDVEDLSALLMELAQPVYTINTIGKVIIEKTPSGAKSPNLADAVMIAFNPTAGAMDVWGKLAQ